MKQNGYGKKTLAWLCAAILLLSLLPMSGFALRSEDEPAAETVVAAEPVGEEAAEEIIEVPAAEELAEEPAEAPAEEPAAESEAEEVPAEEAAEEQPDAEVSAAEAPEAEEQAEEVVEDGEGEVCQIGTTKYAAVGAAINAAKPAGESATTPTVIQMIANSQESVTIPTGRYITLDLNGYELRAASYMRVITNKGTLTITDNSEAKNGKISGGYANSSNNLGGGVYVDGGSFTMTGGTISGCGTASDGCGGGVYVQNGSFIMTGGSISNNSSDNGGGVFVRSGSFTMTGGSITGNKAQGEEDSEGGGVFVFGGSFTMTGGSISNNSSDNGGGVFVSGGTITLGGTAVITGNKVGTTVNNVYLNGDKTITVGTGKQAPAEGMSVGVSNSGPVTAKSSADYSAYFKSDNTDYSVYNNGMDNAQQVYIGNTVARITETNIHYASVQNAVDAAESGQTVQMVASSQENVTVASDDNITLDLNGYVLSAPATGGSVIQNTGTLTIKDSNSGNQSHNFAAIPFLARWTLNETDGNRTLTGGCITGGTGTAVEYHSNCVGGGIANNGTLEIQGGNVVGNTAVWGSGIYSNGTLTVSGGTIIGNGSATSLYGGGVYIEGYSKKSTFALSGGVIAENAAEDGGGVMLWGSDYGAAMEMTGGEISKNEAEYGGGIMNWGNWGEANTGVTLSGGSIKTNEADYGGGIYNYSDALLTLKSGAEIKENNAKCGAGIYNYWSGMSMEDGSITGNIAKYAGGGICNDCSNTTISGGSITGNKVTCDDVDSGYGGGICNYKTDIDNNIEYGNVYISGGSISDNEADYGGGVGNDGDLEMTGGTIADNTAAERGGGVYNYGSLTMTGGSITGNTAGSYGGGVFAAASDTVEVGAEEPEFIVGGSANVTGNTVNGKASNVHLQDLVVSPESANPEENAAAATDGAPVSEEEIVVGHALMTVADGAKKPTTMKIGVTTYIEPSKEAPKQITTNGTTADAQYFTSDAGFYVRYLKDFGDEFPTAIYLSVEAPPADETDDTPAAEDTAKKQAPSTGDNNALGLWLGLAGVSVIALGVALTMKRKES